MQCGLPTGLSAGVRRTGAPASGGRGGAPEAETPSTYSIPEESDEAKLMWGGDNSPTHVPAWGSDSSFGPMAVTVEVSSHSQDPEEGPQLVSPRATG